MSVELDPVELGFRRPFTQEVSQVLRLRNPHSDPVAFKVKTTAPKQYCVRPNSGRIEAGQHVEVQVLLQAMKEDPPLDFKCKDKFLVQSIAITADRESDNVAAIWSHIEKTAKSSIQEKKIRVLFLQPEGAPNGVHHHQDAPPAYRSDSPAGETYTPNPNRVSTAPSGPVSHIEDTPEGNKHLGDAVASANNPEAGYGAAAAATIASAATAVKNAVPTSQDDLQAQLQAAKSQISNLKEQLGDSDLRQRKVQAVATDAREKIAQGTTAIQQQAHAAGVPVQVVAGLCLLCFLIAYFFF